MLSDSLSTPMIKLTENEIILFYHLKLVAEQNGVILRAAGGWVRDKLLDSQSHDIDIAVEHSSGYDFAVKFMSHLKQLNLETHSIGQIMANPEKSKNL
jgi:tRNA nucleotidyltransferase (CCA-adding enzyme)